MENIPFEEESASLRGILKVGEKNYFIINEIYSYPYMKLLTAGFIENEAEVEDEKYTIIHFDKKYIEQTLLEGLSIEQLGNNFEKNFQNLKEEYSELSKIKHENILQIIDCTENKKSIYFICEYCDTNLEDYCVELRNEHFIYSDEMEAITRQYIVSILNCLLTMHEQKVHFLGLIDIKNIFMVQQKQEKTIKRTIKLLHPALSSLITLLKVYDKKNFPDFFAREIYEKLANKNEIVTKIISTHSFSVIRDEIYSIPNFIYDYWSVGILVYKIIFNQPPFKVTSLGKIDYELEEGKQYEIKSDCLSSTVEELITNCLKIKKRFDLFSVEKMLTRLQDDEAVQEELEERIRKKKGEKNTFFI